MIRFIKQRICRHRWEVALERWTTESGVYSTLLFCVRCYRSKEVKRAA